MSECVSANGAKRDAFLHVIQPLSIATSYISLTPLLPDLHLVWWYISVGFKIPCKQ